MPVEGTPERVTLWATGGRVLMQLQVIAGGRGGQNSERRSRGQLGLSRDFMKASVAATPDVHAQQSVHTLSARSCRSIM